MKVIKTNYFLMNPIDCYLQNIPMGDTKKPIFDCWFDSLESFRKKHPNAIIGEKSPEIQPVIPVKESPALSTKSSPSLIKTRMCKNILQDGHCRFRKCNFAHSAAELNPMQCKFKTKCKSKDSTCTFIHPKESKEMFVERLKKLTRAK